MKKKKYGQKIMMMMMIVMLTVMVVSNGSKQDTYYTPGPIQKAEDVVLIKPLEQHYELQILSPSLYRQGNKEVK